MKIFLFLSISYAFTLRLSTLKTTLPVQERIEKLKRELRTQIQTGNRNAPDSYAYSYEEKEYDKDWVIHPIPKATFEGLYKHPMKPVRTGNASNSNVTIKKTKKKTTVKGHTHKSRNELRAVIKAQKASKSEIYMLNPLDIFYRRGLQVFTDEANIKWVQCQDLITPYLTGIKKEPSIRKKIGPQDPIPKRLFEMLNLNTDHFTQDDVYTVIYQISKLQIRLFQWDVMPIRMLMNIFTKGKLHTFRNVKHGIKDLFARWRLTMDNMTNILENTQMIRPPCVETSRYSGSTKSNKVSKFKDWTTKLTTRCDVDDWTCDERK